MWQTIMKIKKTNAMTLKQHVFLRMIEDNISVIETGKEKYYLGYLHSFEEFFSKPQ